MFSYYEILGLTAEASQEDIKDAFEALSLRYNPSGQVQDVFYIDNIPLPFDFILEAYENLSRNRQAYDQLLWIFNQAEQVTNLSDLKRIIAETKYFDTKETINRLARHSALNGNRRLVELLGQLGADPKVIVSSYIYGNHHDAAEEFDDEVSYKCYTEINKKWLENERLAYAAEINMNTSQAGNNLKVRSVYLRLAIEATDRTIRCADRINKRVQRNIYGFDIDLPSICLSKAGDSLKFRNINEDLLAIYPSLKQYMQPDKTTKKEDIIPFLRSLIDSPLLEKVVLCYWDRTSSRCYPKVGDLQVLLTRALRAIDDSYNTLFNKIESIGKRFQGLELTEQKKEILANFCSYCAMYAPVNQDSNDSVISRKELVDNWISSYTDKNGYHPYTILSQHRYTGFFSSWLNPEETNSIKLFNQFIKEDPGSNSSLNMYS